MRIFFTTLVLFLAAFGVHFVLWKVRLPKNHTRALLVIYACVFVLWLAVHIVRGEALLPMAQVGLYYWAVSLCYIITYSAVEGDSPTLSLMRFLSENGGEGRSREEIARFMEARPFIAARIAALINSGLIYEREGRYQLAGRPSLGFRLILGFRRLYGPIPKGG